MHTLKICMADLNVFCMHVLHVYLLSASVCVCVCMYDWLFRMFMFCWLHVYYLIWLCVSDLDVCCLVFVVCMHCMFVARSVCVFAWLICIFVVCTWVRFAWLIVAYLPGACVFVACLVYVFAWHGWFADLLHVCLYVWFLNCMFMFFVSCVWFAWLGFGFGWLLHNVLLVC